MTLEKSDSRNLKKALGRGGIKQAWVLFNEKMKQSEQAEVSYETFSMVIRGDHDRHDIVDFTIEYARKEKEKKDALVITTSNRIKELIEK